MHAFCYTFSKFVCWLFFRFGFGLEVRGREHVPKRGAFILACNHVSYLDPPLVGAACPRRMCFLAQADLYQRPLLGAFLRSIGAIALRRNETDLGAIRAALWRLREGQPIAIFPEGGRQVSGKLGEAKRGVGLLAISAQVPIIPVLVSGTFEAWPPHAARLSRAKIRVAFGSSIPYTYGSVQSAVPSGTPVGEQGRAAAARDHQKRLAQAVTERWRHLRIEEQRHDHS